MTRIALILVTLTLAAQGCRQQEEDPQMYTATPAESESLDTLDAEAGSMTYEPAPMTYGDEMEPATTTGSIEIEDNGPSAPPGAQVHVVRPKDTLFKLAREYYNDQSRWRDIWNANRNRIADPDQLRVGMELVIP